MIGNYNDLERKEVLTKGTKCYICNMVRESIALIEVKDTLYGSVGYEVWKLRTRPKTDKYAPGHIQFPSNEEFGKYGWFYRDMYEAAEKFAELVRSEENGI